MNKKPKGNLIIIGGAEDKEGDMPILKEVAERARSKKSRLAVVTVATNLPEEVGREYIRVFNDLGVRQVDVVDIRTREEAYRDSNVETIMKSSVVFFTGGDQLRITSQVGDSPVYRCLYEIYVSGGTIAGTSAGAAAMSETMMLSGPSDKSNEITALGMAPGLGLVSGLVIDTHFAERGRISRLIGAVAQNPRNLGVGINEDTAIVIEGDKGFRVLGSGAVYLVDGTGVTYSSLSEKNPEGMLSIFDVKLHVLTENDIFDLQSNRPFCPEKPKSVVEPIAS